MKTARMRDIDQVFGVPLCWALTLLDKLNRLFIRSSPNKSAPKNILFIKPSEMGAIILSRPLLNRIRKDHPEAELFFLTFKVNSPVFEVLDVIPPQNVLTIRHDTMFLFLVDVITAISRLRKIKVDIVFDLEFFSRCSAILSYTSDARKRIGFDGYTLEGLYRGDLLTHKVQYNPHWHISRMYLAMAQVAKESRKMTPELSRGFDDAEIVLPMFVLDPGQRKAMQERLSGAGVGPDAKIFIVNPGEGNIPLREWPLENFVQLSCQLLEDKRNVLVIAGASGVEKKSEQFHREINSPRCLNWINTTTIPELLTLFSVAEALIVNDSGLAHLASLTKIKQFVLFGPETPSIFSSLGKNVVIFYSNLPCSPCLSAYNHRQSTCTHNLCLKSIGPQDVYRVICEESASATAVPRAALAKE